MNESDECNLARVPMCVNPESYSSETDENAMHDGKYHEPNISRLYIMLIIFNVLKSHMN